MDFTERDNQLLNRLLGCCEDYTQDELLQAVARLLLHASEDPFSPINPRRVRNLIFEGEADASHVQRDRGWTREEALLLAVGYIQGILKHYQPGRRIPVE